MISENSRLICELVEEGKKSIWDDADTGNAEEPASSSKREVTPSITEASSSSNTVLPSGSQKPPTQAEAKEEIDLAELAQKLEEQDMVDSLEDALDVDMPGEVIPEADSAAPVEKRRRKKRNKIELPEGPPVVEDPYQGQPLPAEKALKKIVVMRKQEEEVMSEDEESDAQFLAERIAADEAKERRERRQQLLREVAAEDSTEHLMKAVD